GRGAPPQRVTFGYLQRGFQARRHRNAGGSEFRISCDDNVGAVFQGFPEGKVSLSPHYDRMTDSECAKPLEIRFEPPRQPASAPDYAIFGHSCDENQRNRGALSRGTHQTATFALMCGYGS